MLLQNCPPVLSSISVFSICKGCQSFFKTQDTNINKYLSYTGVNRPGDGPCPLAAYLVTGTGSTSFFGEKYTSGVGDGSLRTLYYGSLLRETMGLTSTKNKYLFVQWDGDHRDLYTGPRSLDYNSLLLHLKIPIHTPRSSFCVWPPAYNMIQLQCLMNERTEQNHLKNCIMLLYWC